MIRLKNIIELFRLLWKSKSKSFLLISDSGVAEFPDYLSAKKKGLEMIKNRDVDVFRIALELSIVEFQMEVKR